MFQTSFLKIESMNANIILNLEIGVFNVFDIQKVSLHSSR